ncbi:hypothetical protein ABZ839_33300 [Streptomyces cellulosae]
MTAGVVPADVVPTVMHVRCPDRLPGETYRQVPEELAELSPVVQALSPSAALVELKGALRYYRTDTRRLGEMVRVRTVSRLGADVRVGIGSSTTVAATASAQLPQPGGVLAVAPGQAGALHEYGTHTVGRLAAISPATIRTAAGTPLQSPQAARRPRHPRSELWRYTSAGGRSDS